MGCTDDFCDVSLGRCTNTANDTNCDDSDACTIDSCVRVSGLCNHVEKSCDDDIQCTVDSCCEGICKHEANDTSCDDGIECTEDYCDISLGKCVNVPRDDYCDDTDDCTIDICDMNTESCLNIPLDCSDNLTCTDDSWLAGVSIHHANDTHCNDQKK